MEICGHSLLLTCGGQRPKPALHSQSIVQPADLACHPFFVAKRSRPCCQRCNEFCNHRKSTKFFDDRQRMGHVCGPRSSRPPNMMQVPQVPPCIGVVYPQRIRASLETFMTLHTERVSRFRDHALQGDIFLLTRAESNGYSFSCGLGWCGLECPVRFRFR